MIKSKYSKFILLLATIFNVFIVADKSTIIYLVRHGETEWNRSRQVDDNIQRIDSHDRYSNYDHELNLKGIEQAKLVSKYFSKKNIKISEIYSSDLSRAYKTAKIVAEKFDLTVKKDKRLRERTMGLFEGLGFVNGYARYPKYKGKSLKSIPGLETFKQVEKRIVPALQEIERENKNEIIVIVTHGGVIRTLYNLINNISEKVVVGNASISKIIVNNGKWRIDTKQWGYEHHLGSLVSPIKYK